MGIIIEVLTVIIVLFLGNGAICSVKSEIESIGSNIFYVVVKGSRYATLSMSDLKSLKMNSQFLTNINPSFSIVGNFKYEANEISAQYL
ncbi:hypothetical protein [Thermosipho melanesiensis]|uniref:hypothetical protein n=1 Tax=Thermosipho melanesiensis TaxID=46541 RepID=UPI0015D66C1F|nr:hypothetical protein [Thermosipho melanesiensis]